MYVQKVKDHELILDSHDDFLMLQTLGKTTPKNRIGSFGIWIDMASSLPYACIHRYGRRIKVHHIFVGHPLGRHVVDHINRNTLDNRRENLRVIPKSLNALNAPLSVGKLPRWVTLARNGRYCAHMRLYFGTYDTPEEAHAAAYKFAKEYYKDLILPEVNHESQ